MVREAVTCGAVMVVGDWLAPPDDVRQLRAARRDRTSTHTTSTNRCRPASSSARSATALGHPADQLRAALEGLDSLAVEQGVVVDPSRTQRAADTDAGRALIALLDASPFAPPEPADPVLARALVREGALVDVDGLMFTTGALTLARASLRAGARRAAAAVSVAEVRELLASSRKYVVPLLEQFDREGLHPPPRRRAGGRAEDAISCSSPRAAHGVRAR